MKKIMMVLLIIISLFILGCKSGENPIVDPPKPGETDPIDSDPNENDPTDPDPINPTDPDPTNPVDPVDETSYINTIDFSFDFKTNKLGEIEGCTISIKKDEREYDSNLDKDVIKYHITLNANEGYEFSSNVAVNDINKLNPIATLSDNKTLIIDIKETFNVLHEVKIDLDTRNYTVTSNSSDYQSEIKKPLDYLYIITIIKFTKEPSVDFCFKVYNVVKSTEVVVKEKDYTMEYSNGEYTITYKISDPNWTPYY